MLMEDFMEIDNSLKNLFKQFCRAYGIKKVDPKDKVLVRTFFEWLETEKKEKDDFYRKLLKIMNLDIDNKRTVEVGKTVHDSIVLPYETRIVTPYEKGFEDYKERVTIANLRFHGSLPILIQKGVHVDHAIPVDMYDKFITQNPYTGKEIADWNNFQHQDIIVGVYGDINDADRKNKMRQMNEFYNKLDPGCKPKKEYVAADYNYAAVITTNKTR